MYLFPHSVHRLLDVVSLCCANVGVPQLVRYSFNAVSCVKNALTARLMPSEIEPSPISRALSAVALSSVTR